MNPQSDSQVPPTAAAIKRRTSPRRAVLVCLVLAGIATAGAVAFTLVGTLPKRFATVDEGILYRCSQPSISQLANLKESHNLRTVLIVRRGDSRRVPDEAARARELGMNVVHLQIDSRRYVTDEEVQAFFDCMDNTSNHPVLIHCSAGRHRTGYLCALYRIERQGWTVERALEEMRSFGGFDEDPPHVIEQQLRNYAPQRNTKRLTVRHRGATGDHQRFSE